MSRARMNGILATLIIATGAVAGCGGTSGGSLSAQSAPTGTTPTTPAETTPGATAPAPDPSGGVVQAIPAEDPKDPKFKRFDQFPLSESSGIFVPPKSVQDAASAGTEDAAALLTDPSLATSPTTAPTTPDPTTQTNVRTTTIHIAQAEVDGKPQTLQVNSPVPTANPQFTVKSIGADKVTLKLKSGTFPGGSDTIDIAAGSSVTLSNPATGAAIFILVKGITPVAV